MFITLKRLFAPRALFALVACPHATLQPQHV
jgi:hypothetical protein